MPSASACASAMICRPLSPYVSTSRSTCFVDERFGSPRSARTTARSSPARTRRCRGRRRPRRGPVRGRAAGAACGRAQSPTRRRTRRPRGSRRRCARRRIRRRAAADPGRPVSISCVAPIGSKSSGRKRLLDVGIGDVAAQRRQRVVERQLVARLVGRRAGRRSSRAAGCNEPRRPARRHPVHRRLGPGSRTRRQRSTPARRRRRSRTIGTWAAQIPP